MRSSLSSFTPTAPTSATPEYPTRSVYCAWGFSPPGWYDPPVVPTRFVVRKAGGWWLVTQPCPFCGQEHKHGSNLDATWDGGPYDPRSYSGQAVYSHCTSKRSIYTLEIVAGLPAEAKGQVQR